MSRQEKYRAIIGLTPHNGQPDDLQEMGVACAVALASGRARDKGRTEVTIATNTLNNIAQNTVSLALGDDISCALVKQKTAMWRGVRLTIATPKMKGTWPPHGDVVALWVEKRILDALEANPRIDAIYVVPWLDEDFSEWRDATHPVFVDPYAESPGNP
jgi:hypothetical protein